MKAVIALVIPVPADVDTEAEGFDINVVANTIATILTHITDDEVTVRSAELED